MKAGDCSFPQQARLHIRSRTLSYGPGLLQIFLFHCQVSSVFPSQSSHLHPRLKTLSYERLIVFGPMYRVSFKISSYTAKCLPFPLPDTIHSDAITLPPCAALSKGGRVVNGRARTAQEGRRLVERGAKIFCLHSLFLLFHSFSSSNPLHQSGKALVVGTNFPSPPSD